MELLAKSELFLAFLTIGIQHDWRREVLHPVRTKRAFISGAPVVTPSTQDYCSRPLRGSLYIDAISEKTARSILRGLLQILGVSTNELLV
jgi:hypothetical protein